VFDTNGNLVKHLVTEGGKLNAPWGMALAPADFGTLGNALLVGNFGDGAIHGYDPSSGRYLGAVSNGAGTPFSEPGLWGVVFGNDAANQPHATLFFAAGINGEVNGRYGRIDLGQTPPALGEPPALTLLAPPGDLSGTVTLQANAQNLVAIAKVQFFVNGSTPIGTATSEPFTVEWDTTKVSNGGATLRAVATDASGNVGSSRVLTVSVANAPAAATTLTQVQQTVFTPRCAGCHDGSQPAGGSLPGAMDLKSGNSFASLVNRTSLQQPALMRVKPGEPANSYLIHKLEGAPGISGARMPFGGPFLDQTTIEQVESWIASGAPNN
jgi:mono/diheme cytochrome c family protein